MPPQPEYVLVRDKARDLIYLAERLVEEREYSIICLLTHIAEELLKYSINRRLGINNNNHSIDVSRLVQITLSLPDKNVVEECIRRARRLLDDVNRVFIERREEECGCWGE